MSSPVNSTAPDSAGVPPRLDAARPARVLMSAFGVAAIVTVGILLFLFNPADHAFYPQCFFHQATGLHCPGCGGLRAAHQLLHGHLLAALRLNTLAVFSLPLLTGILVRELAGRRRGIRGQELISVRLVWWFVGMLLVFTVLRNLAGFSFLAP